MLEDLMADSLALVARHLSDASKPANPVLWASGGKDSLALMHLVRAWADAVTVLHTQVDDGWPGQTQNLVRQGKAWGYRHIDVLAPKMRFDDYVQVYGWPMHVVPTAYEGASAITSPLAKEGPRMSSWVHCQLTRIILPLAAGTALHQSGLVITGTKLRDGSHAAKLGDVFDARNDYGWLRINPLLQWTDDDVYEYVDRHAITLPEHYRYKRQSGSATEWSDCMSCTFNPDHWRLLKQHYPEEFKRRWRQVKPVYEAYAEELLSAGSDALGLVQHGAQDPIRAALKE